MSLVGRPIWRSARQHADVVLVTGSTTEKQQKEGRQVGWSLGGLVIRARSACHARGPQAERARVDDRWRAAKGASQSPAPKPTATAGASLTLSLSSPSSARSPPALDPVPSAHLVVDVVGVRVLGDAHEVLPLLPASAAAASGGRKRAAVQQGAARSEDRCKRGSESRRLTPMRPRQSERRPARQTRTRSAAPCAPSSAR